MAENFEVGDVVKLKSGAPKMTVIAAGKEDMTGEPFTSCRWFVGMKSESASFPPDALVLVSEVEVGRLGDPARRT
jgi:uncharacterized protein YodC (DUF2158 family)